MLIDLEMNSLSLEVDIEYDFIPGEKMVRYYRDGSGDPGCPPSAELTKVTVMKCDMATEQRRRCDHWIWRALDMIAQEVISRDWDQYEERCIEEANDRAERDYDE